MACDGENDHADVRDDDDDDYDDDGSAVEVWYVQAA